MAAQPTPASAQATPGSQTSAPDSANADDAAWAALAQGGAASAGAPANGAGAPPANAANDDDAAWVALGGSKATGAPPPAPAAAAAPPAQKRGALADIRDALLDPLGLSSAESFVEHPLHNTYEALKGFVGESNRTLTFLKRLAGQSGEGLAATEDPEHAQLAVAAHDEFYKQFVEPSIQNQALYELPEDASVQDKTFHGLGETAAMIAQVIASGGSMAGEAATARVAAAGAPKFLARAAGGGVSMTLPATQNAVEVGNQVKEATGDTKAATIAGIMSYLTSAAQGMIPMGVGGPLPVRMVTAGLAGVGLQEGSRLAQNAAMPADMTPEERREADQTPGATKHPDLQQPFSLENAESAAIATAPFGLLPHAPEAPTARGGGRGPVGGGPGEGGGGPPLATIADVDRQASLGRAARTGDLLQNAEAEDSLGAVDQQTAPAHRPVVEAGPQNAMELGQQHAADIVREAGGDNLSQVVAATHANAVLSAHHDGAAVGALQERRMAALEAQRQEAENDAAMEAQGLREQGLNAAQSANAPAVSVDQAFALREAEKARQWQQKDRDFTAALNQRGDQQIEDADRATAGAEKGGATEARPTVADALPPEQLAALQSLRERRAAKPVEPTVQEKMKAQAKGTPDDFQALPPETPTAPANRLAAIRQAAQKRAAATAPVKGRALLEAAEDEDEELPARGPSAPTKQTLAQVRQANFDKAMRAKLGTPAEVAPVRGKPLSPEAQANANQPIAEGRAKAAELLRPAVEDLNRQLGAGREEPVPVPNKAVTPRRAKQVIDTTERTAPAREEKQFVARNADTGAEVARFNDFDAAQAHKARFPNEDITHEAAVNAAPEDVRRQQTREALGNLLGRAGKRMDMEGHGQDILDNLQENGTKVNDVANKFWDDTYFKLPAEVQARFRGELENHAGMKKGSMTDVADTVKNHMDLPDNPAHLEGTDRGFVALMDEANRRVAGTTEGEQRPSTALLHGRSAAETAAREAEFKQDTDYKRLMAAKTGEHEALVSKMTPEEANDHLNRLNAAPGDNPAARAALEARVRAEPPTARKTLALGANRFADSNTVRVRPDQVEHSTDGAFHVARSPHGETHAVDTAGGNLRVTRDDTAVGARGRGEGIARSERLAQDIHSRGGRLTSDVSVSPDQERVWDALARRGYDVQRDPGAVRNADTGNLISSDPRKTVFSAGPKKAGALAARRGDDAAWAAATRGAPPQGGEAIPGERRGPAITKEEATQRLQPLIDRVGAGSLHVHDSLNDPEVPQNVRDDAVRFNHPDPRAAFDPKTGAVHVFAGAGGHTDIESLHNTAVHDLAHRGIRRLLGPDYADTMQSIYDNIHNRASAMKSPIDGIKKVSAREWMEDYMSQHAMDPKSPEHQMTAADEYAAHLAEHDIGDPRQENPSILRKVYDAVRAGLRKLGVVHEWTDNDIRQLLRESNNNPESPHARAAREDFGNGIRWADSPDRSVERLPPDDPRAIGAKYRQVLATSAQYNPGYIKSRLDALSHLRDFLPDWADHGWDQTKDGLRKLWLYSIPMDKLPDHVNPDLNPSVRGYVRQVRRMNGRIGEQMAASHEIYKPWNEFAAREPERAARLDDLMHESTLAGVDPSKPFEYRFTEEQRAKSPKKTEADAARKESHAELSKQFRSLGEEGQKIYRDVRDAYKQQRADYDGALEKRMVDLGMSDSARKQIKDLLTRTGRESGRVVEPYFPLARWGDRFAVAKHAGTDDVHSYSRFETNRQQKQWADAMRAEGFDVAEGRDTGNSRKDSSGVDPAFLHKVLELTKDFEPKEGEAGKSSIADEIYQHYLASLPDRSYRKMFMHRTGRLGFAGNARRAFADQSIRHAKAVAQIEYGHRLDAMLQNVRDEHKAVAKLASENPSNRYLQREAEWAPAVRSELEQRNAAIRNPGSSKFVNAMTGFGFHYYLGFNPATAARIHTQQYINALPWLGARHGWGPAALELQKAMGQYASTRGNFGDALRGNERKAWDEMNENGTFMNTQAQSLTAASRGDSLQRAGTSNAAKWAARANFASTAMFNGVEHFNRETTAMAAYRLARQEGMAHGAALEHAMTASDTTHFDYNPANRPRILQGQAGKVGGLFAQYGVHQAYRIMRDARDGLLGNANISPRERRARLMTLAGMLGMSTLFSGLGGVGTPIFGAINMAVNANSDEPAFDSKAALHAYLVQHLGSKFLADSVMAGPVSAATGVSLASTGLWDVFHREASGDTAHANWYTRIAPYVPIFGSMLQGGPLGELGQDVSTAASDIKAGNYERAIEHLLPMGFRGAPKALRHALYGEQSPNALPLASGSNQTMTKSEFGIRAFLAQLANFQPQSLADRREENAAKENAVRSVSGEPGTGGPRAEIMRQILLAATQKDQKALDKAIAQAKKFNTANPTMAITYDALHKSAQAQGRNAAEEIHGVTLPKGLRLKLQELYSQDLPDESTAPANETPQ